MRIYRVRFGQKVVTFVEGSQVVATVEPGREAEIGAPAIVVVGGVAIRGAGGLADVERALLAAEVVGDVGAGAVAS